MEARLQLSILPDERVGEAAVSPTPLPERETTIRRADDEGVWHLWSDDPRVVNAMRRLAGRPGVAVREDGGTVWATFPAKALKLRGLPKPTKPCGIKPPENALTTAERETIFERRRGADAWEVATTSPKAQAALLAFAGEGGAVTVRRSERRREELIFTVPCDAVRIVPPTARLLETARKAREAVSPEGLAAQRAALQRARGEGTA